MDRHSSGRSVPRQILDSLWLLVVTSGAALVLFVASHDDSLVRGRFVSALLWLALWIGTVAVRRPRILPDAVSLGIAIAGVPLVLLAPLASSSVFVGSIVVAWAALTAASMTYRRREPTDEAGR